MPDLDSQMSIAVGIPHIKAISSFPLTAKLKEINAATNVLGLCPNCHWEYDHGLLKW
jgi:hypothetical protein